MRWIHALEVADRPLNFPFEHAHEGRRVCHSDQAWFVISSCKCYTTRRTTLDVTTEVQRPWDLNRVRSRRTKAFRVNANAQGVVSRGGAMKRDLRVPNAGSRASRRRESEVLYRRLVNDPVAVLLLLAVLLLSSGSASELRSNLIELTVM
jgi:hypothetical protein